MKTFLSVFLVSILVLGGMIYTFRPNSSTQETGTRIASVSESTVAPAQAKKNCQCCSERVKLLKERVLSRRTQEQWARAMIKLYGQERGLKHIEEKFPGLAQTLSSRLTP